MHQHYAHCDCDPKGTDGYGLDFAGDASVLLKVTNIRAQQQQERGGRQNRQEHPGHTQPERHGPQYDQQIIHTPKVAKIIFRACKMQKSLRRIPEGFSYVVLRAGLPAVSVGVDLAQELADGHLKLLVTALDEFLGLVAYLEVRLKLGVLQIVTVACAVSDDRYAEVHRGILEGLPVDGGHGSRYGHTYYRTDLLVLVYPGRAVGVGVVVLAHEHD